MNPPVYLYQHLQTEDEDENLCFETLRYRVVRVTAERIFVARKPEGEWSPEDGTFSFSRAAIEAGEVVGRPGHGLLTTNPNPAAYWDAMTRAVLVEGQTRGPIIA